MKKIGSILGITMILAGSTFALTGCLNGDVKEYNEKNNLEIKEVKEDISYIDNNDSYFFMVDGKKFNAGDKISDLGNVGISVREKEKDEEVPANKYMIGAGYMVNAEKKDVFQVTPYNLESTPTKVAETCIGGFRIEDGDIKNDSRVADVEVCGGIKLGSSQEDVKKIFGEPSSVYEGKYYNSYKYDSSEVYRDYEFRFSKDEGKVIYIGWQNLVFDK